MNDLEQRRRLRKLYSLGDFQLALSAAAFLAECESDKKYTKIELRRFRCYETTMIISYARPFSQSSFGLPKLSLKMVGITFSPEQLQLHTKLLNMRNKVIAHSDEEMMRMTSQADPLEIDSDFHFVFLQTVFDEGLTFIGDAFFEVNELLRLVQQGLYVGLLHEAQTQAAQFNIRKDYTRE